tara:strand:- start:8 stop:577 length:570 start_codon:yes stop_codon:yes gene_type:complete
MSIGVLKIKMTVKLTTIFYLFWAEHKNLIFCLIFCFLSLPLLSTEVGENNSIFAEIKGNEVVKIKAKSGYKLLDAKTLSLEGDVVFESVDWKITGEKMKISGQLSSPDAIIVDGNLATIQSANMSGNRPLKAVGKTVKFDFLSNRIFAIGDAYIKTDSQHFAGPSLVYSYDAGKLSSSGEGRVKFHSKK